MSTLHYLSSFHIRICCTTLLFLFSSVYCVWFCFPLMFLFIKGRGCTYSYCGKYESCSDCITDPFCGWCDSLASCFGGFAEGPPKISCPDWFFHHCYTVGDQNSCSNNIQVRSFSFWFEFVIDDLLDLFLIRPKRDIGRLLQFAVWFCSWPFV